MKIPTSRREHGFTLVELLVVIAIIAVLAAAGFAAGNAAILKARKVTCLASATAVESAVNNFFTEYGSMPTESTTEGSEVATDASEGKKLVNVLLGLEGATATNILNVRGVRFLSAKEGKKRKVGGVDRGTNGLIYSTDGKTTDGLFDPWGGSFKIMMDLDYDEKITVKPKAGVSKVLNGRRVAVWSDGADGITNTGKAGDDVITWTP